MIHLRSVDIEVPEEELPEYPFTVPALRNLGTLTFTTPVCFLVGENGTGKSTLLEGIAAAADSIVAGGQDIRHDPTLSPARELGRHLRLAWHRKTHRGFFLRAEDFFNYHRRVAQSLTDLSALAKSYEESMEGYGLELARDSTLGQRQALVARYGEEPDARSHGEGFLHFFQERFVGNGLYLLDEPDTPLSPQRELSLLYLLKQMVQQDSQFIIATHSPILMAFPGATIISFDHSPPCRVPYDEVPQVTLTRDFLRHPGAFLRDL